jgi:hypothetical protein
VTRRLAAVLGCTCALLAGCSGGEQASPAASTQAKTSPPPPVRSTKTPPPGVARIVRRWSTALNAGDNEAAADLFARGARVIQGSLVFVLRTRDDAVRWNAALPCSGRIVKLEVRRNVATAEFVLGDRQTSPCDGPGNHATAEFRVRAGKIVQWRQLPTEQPAEPAI